MRKLGKVQLDVLASLRHYGFWHARCGWVWDTLGNTQRVMDSLVRAGYATRSGIVYRPSVPSVVEPKKSTKQTMRTAVFLSGGHVIDGNDVPGMLKRQHAILFKLSRDLAKQHGYGESSAAQKAIADANMLGLEVADRLQETEENKR